MSKPNFINAGNYTMTKTGESNYKYSTRTNYQISTSNKTFLKPDDIKYIVNGFQKKHPNAEFLVTGLGVAGMHELADTTKHEQRTLKTLSGDFMFLNEEEYLDGRVREETKFLQYFQIQLSILKPKNI